LLKALLERLFTLFAPPVVENAGTQAIKARRLRPSNLMHSQQMDSLITRHANPLSGRH
jgi:hypothetical protein